MAPRTKSEIEAWTSQFRTFDNFTALPPEQGRAGAAKPAAADLPGEDRAAFETAGWQFVPRDRAILGLRPVEPPEGGLVLLGDRLQLRLSSELSEAAALDVMAKLGIEPVRRLGFAENSWLARAPDWDVLGAVSRLNAQTEVDYAEPVLIAPLPSR